MKLKCIGGELDGYRYEVDNYRLRDGEYISLPAPVSRLAVNFDPDEIPKEISYNVLYYKILTINLNNKDKHSKQHYLIPEDWSYREAILYQFGK